jgi:5-methyltetrahydrofolate--homocysteine methyltransferase
MPTVISGRDGEVRFGPGLPTVIIGERINPTGRKKLAARLAQGDLDVVGEEALSQKRAGAEILDVNVGTGAGREEAQLPEAVQKALEATGLPICIDSASAVAMRAALKVYPHKPLVNSVTGEEESLETILPLVREHRAAVIAMPVDENGLSKSVSSRVEIARRIVDRAASHGIAPEDVVIDCMAMAASTDAAAVGVTLEVIRVVTRDLRLSTTMGVSNISFGMPERHTITSAFLAMAIEAGLSAAIIDPTVPGMVYTVLSSNFLCGRDEYAGRYLSYYRASRQ